MENKKLFNISRIFVDSLIVIFVLASTLMMAFKGQGSLASKGVEMFKYYTVDSNILMGIAALIKSILILKSLWVRLKKYLFGLTFYIL